MVAKWFCSKCHKVFYTDYIGEGSEPTCHCSWESKVRFVWVDFEPTKRVWDEIRENGCTLKRKFVTKRDAWIFSAHYFASDDKEAQDMIDKLPF